MSESPLKFKEFMDFHRVLTTVPAFGCSLSVSQGFSRGERNPPFCPT